MAETTIRESRRQALIRLVGCVAFSSVGIWCAQANPNFIEDAMLYAGATFFAILAIRYLWSVCRPGTLTIDRDGLTLNLGWRRLHWAWDEIDRAELVRTPGNLASAYMIYPRVGGRVRLFGWRTSTKDLQRQIERFLQT